MDESWKKWRHVEIIKNNAHVKQNFNMQNQVELIHIENSKR